MPKRKRYGKRKRTRRRKKAKAKTRVDKRQDRVIRKLVLESMPEKKWITRHESHRIPSAVSTGNLLIQGICLTDQIPIWDSSVAHANLTRLSSREGMEIVARNINFRGILKPPRVNRVEYDDVIGAGRLQSEWPEHFITRIMIVKFSKPCDNAGGFTAPTLSELLETPKFSQTDCATDSGGWNVLVGESPCPQYSRFLKPYDGPRFKVVYNKVYTMEGAKQNICDLQPTSNTPMQNPGLGPVDNLDLQTRGTNTNTDNRAGAIEMSIMPTMLHSTRPIPFNINIPLNEKLKYEQTGAGGTFGTQVTNKYVMYAYACNEHASDTDESPLVTFEFDWRVNFTDP